MRHNFLDHYSDLASPVHKTDPRLKLLLAIVFVCFVVSTSAGGYLELCCYGAFVICLLLFSRVPIIYFLNKIFSVIPVVVLILLFIPFLVPGKLVWSISIGGWIFSISSEGLTFFFTLLFKAGVAISIMILLMASTALPQLLKGMEMLKIPDIFIMLLGFLYRYIFVIEDEAMRLFRARKARQFGATGAKSWWRHFKSTASILSSLFIRAYERSERVYSSMLARGFDGKIVLLEPCRLKWIDGIKATVVVVIIFGIKAIAQIYG